MQRGVKTRAMGVVLAVLLGVPVGGKVGQGAAPPEPPRPLDAEQEKRLADLESRMHRASVAGQFSEALRLARQIHELRQTWQGARHWQAVDARLKVEQWQRLARLPQKQQMQLGLSFARESTADVHSSRGRYAEAEKAHREALAIRLEVLGKDHLCTARSYGKVALCLNSQGRHKDALPLARQALATCLEVLGEDHSFTAAGYNNVAYCLLSQGKHKDALPLFNKALSIYRNVLGEEHPTTALGYSNAASCLDNQGKHKDALPLHYKALAIHRRVLGNDHADTAASYNNLASCLYDQGQYADALPLFQRALANFLAVRGEEHSDTAAGYSNVAACLASQGRHADALPLHEKSLAIRRKVLGETHPDTASSYNSVAACLGNQGKHAEALPLFRRALVISRQALGEEHPDTAVGCDNVASCLKNLGKHADALPLYQQALAIRRKVLGEEHPHTAASCNHLADCLDNQGKHKDALPLFRQALAIRLEVLGAAHPDTAASYNNMGFCLDKQGKHKDALPLFQKALAIRLELLGEEHPHTADSRNNVAWCLNALGKDRDAIPLWQAALLGSDSARLAAGRSGFDRSLFGSGSLTARTGLAITHARQKAADKAWEYAEADLARGLLDDLAPTERADQELQTQVRHLDERLLPLLGLARLSSEQTRLRQQLSRQRRDALVQLSKRAADRSNAAVWPLERIQKQIPADAALVMWIGPPWEQWACVLRRGGPPLWQRLPGSGSAGTWTEADWRLTSQLHRALADISEPVARRDRLVQSVRKQCLTPLLPHLQKQDSLPAVRRLFVVPTRWMAPVPVEVLAPQFTISYVPSGTVFARLMEQHRRLSADAVLALGDPVFEMPAPRQAEPPRQGVLVTQVHPGGNAHRAGIRAGDVLLRYRDTELNSLDDLRPLLGKPGKATASRWRNGAVDTVVLDAGALGMSFDPRSARAAVRAWRRAEGPVVRGQQYQALPGTRIEVQTLRQLVGKQRTTLLLGSLADEQQLDRLNKAGWLSRFRILHLATHGDITDSPGRSALILSRDRLPDPLQQSRAGRKIYDGRLTARTILREWRLDADLVVLSACQTALGADAGTNGLLGFAQVFLSRGARSVVLSRWSVGDTATALLMVRFYENLLAKRKDLKQPLPRAEALAEAKKWLRTLSRKDAEVLAKALSAGVLQGSDGTRGKVVPLNPADKKEVKLPVGEQPFEHPFYWAAFVLVGDPD